MTRAMILVAALAMTGCAGSEQEQGTTHAPAFPEVTESYRLDTEVPTCWDVYLATYWQDSPPVYGCTWFWATYDGQFYAAVALKWERRNGEWVEVFRNLIPYQPESSPVANN